ncbi:MAG: hypothetical protein ACTSYQ_01815, partial [Candidatus Odinarchaeia archaeon]
MSQFKELETMKMRTIQAINDIEDQFSKNKINEEQYKKWKNKLQEYLHAIEKHIKSFKSEDYLSEERFKIYEKQEVQKILTHFLDEKIKRLIPLMDKEYGVRYPTAERIMGSSPLETKNLIDQMVEVNVLIPEVYSKGLRCPRCRSSDIVIHYICPFCQSANFEKGRVIEHYKCHYMDFEIFFRSDNELVCPNCNSVLKQIGVDYQKHGPWFKCEDCKKFFDVPLSTYHCSECGSTFELQQAIFVSLFSYILNKKFIDEYEKVTIPLEELIKTLKKKSWLTRSPAFIIGISGVIHQLFGAFWYKKCDSDVILPVNPDIVMDVITSST